MKKTMILAAGAVAVAGFSASTAQAVDVDVYGQVNKAVMAYDDGTNTEVNFVDNDKSSTRFGFRGAQTLDNGLTASVLYEAESQSNSSRNVDNNDDIDVPSNTAAGLVERHARVGIAGGFGAVFVGRTSNATDGIAEMDVAGVSDVMGSDLGRMGGSFAFRDNTGTLTAVTVDDAYSSVDGGRENLVAYHSPVFNGFQARVSTSHGGDVQTSIRYTGKVSAFEVKAGLGYENKNSSGSTIDDTVAGSVSVKHDSGIAATVAYGSENAVATGTAEGESLYVKLGYSWDAFSVAADFATGEDFDSTGSELEAFGFGAQYNMGSGVSVAGLYRTYSFDDSTATVFEDIDVYMASLRVKF